MSGDGDRSDTDSLADDEFGGFEVAESTHHFDARGLDNSAFASTARHSRVSSCGASDPELLVENISLLPQLQDDGNDDNEADGGAAQPSVLLALPSFMAPRAAREESAPGQRSPKTPPVESDQAQPPVAIEAALRCTAPPYQLVRPLFTESGLDTRVWTEMGRQGDQWHKTCTIRFPAALAALTAASVALVESDGLPRPSPMPTTTAGTSTTTASSNTTVVPTLEHLFRHDKVTVQDVLDELRFTPQTDHFDSPVAQSVPQPPLGDLDSDGLSCCSPNAESLTSVLRRSAQQHPPPTPPTGAAVAQGTLGGRT